MLATFGFSLDYGSYLLAGVTCVPLVKKVLKRRKLVTLCVERIVIIVDGNITNSKPWECDLRVLSAICLAEFVFYKLEFIESCFGHTVDA